MNDDFLHRPRKAPSPEFLAGLKSRLDRQPWHRQPKLARPHWRGFVRGMLVGFVVAGVAFAVTSVSLTGVPISAGEFFSAPVEYVARMLFHAHTTEQDADRSKIKAVPLGPAWYPTYVNPQPASGRQSIQAAPSSDSATYIGPQTALPGTVGTSSHILVVAATHELMPFLRATLPSLVSGARTQVVEKSEQNAFAALCRNPSATDDHRPDLLEVTHRITEEQLRSCNYARQNHEAELQVGYQAVMLARSKLYGPLSLTARDLFLGLARRVPDPEHPDTLIDNPYTTWNQVDPALPYDPIHFIGPAPGSPEGQLAADLLLRAGCNSFPSLVALREHDAAAFDSACLELRGDSAYETAAAYSGFTYANELNTTPTALGIFTLPGFESFRDKLAVNPIDGVAPEHTTLAAHTYPASRTLYLYAYTGNLDWYPVRFAATTLMYVSYVNPATGGDILWGFIELDPAERAARQAALANF
jgi:hypothetical protein